MQMSEKQWQSWRNHVFKRTDPGVSEQTPESIGDFYYFIDQKPLPAIKQNLSPMKQEQRNLREPYMYPVYLRYPLGGS